MRPEEAFDESILNARLGSEMYQSVCVERVADGPIHEMEFEVFLGGCLFQPDLRRVSPILKGEDRAAIEQAGVLLALADDIEERCPRGSAIELSCDERKGEVVVSVPALAAWRPRAMGERFQRTFGRALVVRAGG